MVAPSSSQGSVASSQDNRTTEALRRRREFPRKSDKRRYQGYAALIASSSRGSLNTRDAEVAAPRPPQSSRSKHSLGKNPSERNVGHSPSVQDAAKLVKSRSNLSPTSPGTTPKGNSGGKPPVPPGISIASSTNPTLIARSLSLTKSAINRSGSLLSRTNSVISKTSSPSLVSKSSMTSVEQRQDGPISSRQTFYVRVCLGYLTGVKIKSLKRRTNTSNGIVVGYAALLKSGKRIALSQPLGPNLNKESQKALKLYWTSPKGGSRPSLQTSKRRLDFSLKLEKEVDRESRAEDDSLNSNVECTPEVVKIVIGLKCGEEKFPLGVANLVINGKESHEQKVDLALRPMSEVSSAEMKRQAKSRLGIFGKKHPGISFKNHDQQYHLASNATLRVRMDVKAGAPGESKATIWGDEDDASYITSLSFDTRGTGGSFGLPPGKQQMSTTTGHESGLPFPEPDKRRSEKIETPPGQAGESRDSDRNDLLENLPIRYIIVENYPRGEGLSLASSLTSPTPGYCSWVCIPFCGGESEPPYGSKSVVANSFSFDEALPSYNEMSEIREESVSTQSSEGSLSGGRTETSEEESTRRNAATRKPIMRRPTRKKLFKSTKRSQPGHSLSERGGMTDEAYDDLKGAEATLLRYANKLGIEMEDLLEDS